MNDDEKLIEIMKLINEMRRAGLNDWADHIQDILESDDED